MLRVIGRHKPAPLFEVMRVVINYRKGQTIEKKLIYIKTVPWPDHLPTNEQTLKSP